MEADEFPKFVEFVYILDISIVMETYKIEHQ